ncbi:uncharacterized protein [Argopecten irradians]|uniref:uncharacterized protein n=1 Tax=Argopecten irradians TaxID=31199 RepID=UPI003722D10F
MRSKRIHYVTKSCTEVDSIQVQSSRVGENTLLAGISTSQNQVDSFASFKDGIPDNTLHQLSLNVIKKRHSDSRNAEIEKEHVVTSCDVRKERKQYVKRRRGFPTGSSTDDCPSPKRLARPRTCSKEDQIVSTIITGHILISPGSSKPNNLPNKRLDVAFNTLVTLMNRGLFDEFNSLNNRLRRHCKIDFDMRCVLGYLQANLELHKSNFDGAKQQIESAITICHKTTNPRYFTLELLGTKARMLLYQKKFEKLQEVVDDARMLIETDIVAASGRAAGWLHVQEGRLMASQIDLLNPTRVNFAGAHHLLHKRAKVSFEKALANFQKDKSEYGPVGYMYTMCRLIILLLQCGENGLAMDILRPDPSEIESSGKYLLQVAGSDVTSRKVLNMHYHLASSDYYFRSENMTKAFECADLAHDLAKQLDMNEFMVHAYNRLVFLKAQVLTFSKEIVDTGRCDILFGSSACQVISCDDVETSD